jgi:hypothetical protein
MDTLVVEVPRRRAYGLLALAVVLFVVAWLSDAAGRLLAAPAAVAVLALAVRDLRGGPLLVADPAGIHALQGLRRVHVPWAAVERMRVLRDRRSELLEVDGGEALLLLTRQRLGRLPDDVLTDLLAVRATAAAGEAAEPDSPALGDASRG